jgi:DNA-binding response OmpR family regulator
MKKLLIIETLRPLFARRPSFLDRTDITLSFAETNDDILRRHIEDRADLIITMFNCSDLSAESLFSIIRRSAELKKVLLILACEEAPGLQERARQSGANVMLTLPIDQALLDRKMRELLEVAPRKAYRVVFKLAIDGKFRNQTFLCNSENISASGMLLRARENIAQGDHISCSFYLPDGMRIRAAGEVVRAVMRDTDGTFYGVKFTDLAAEHRAALEAFIDREYRLRLSPAQQESADAA